MNYLGNILRMFVFFVTSSWRLFDTFARDTLRSSPQSIWMPSDGTVYDFFVDPKQGTFRNWSEKQMERSRNSTAHYTVIPEVSSHTGDQ